MPQLQFLGQRLASKKVLQKEMDINVWFFAMTFAKAVIPTKETSSGKKKCYLLGKKDVFCQRNRQIQL